MRFQDLQDEIIAWRDSSLTGVTIDGIIEHLFEELAELREDPHNPLVLADLFILLMSLCEKVGFSMQEMAVAIHSKHLINVNRSWSAPDDFGVIKHVSP